MEHHLYQALSILLWGGRKKWSKEILAVSKTFSLHNTNPAQLCFIFSVSLDPQDGELPRLQCAIQLNCVVNK
jgi:hypothetical protein